MSALTSDQRAVRPPSTARRRTLRQFVPPQHGAWAMLLLPYLAGVLVAGFRWVHLPLLGAWLAGYLFSYYALQAIKTRRPGRFRRQLLWYGSATAVLGAIVLAARPQVLILAPAYLGLLAANAGYAWRRDERALVNDLVSVLQSCLMVFVTGLAAGVAIRPVVPVFLAVLLYFTGTVPHVKAMIRERGNPAYRRASAAYHVVAFAVAAWLVATTRLGIPVAAVFALLLVRAVVLPRLLTRRRITPKQVGVVEIVASGLLLAGVVTA